MCLVKHHPNFVEYPMIDLFPSIQGSLPSRLLMDLDHSKQGKEEPVEKVKDLHSPQLVSHHKVCIVVDFFQV